jgi:signal transduction histidine kinase
VSSIRVFGEFLKTGRAADPKTVRRYGRHIEAEGRRLSRLIDNVLDFSRIESGRKEYEFVDARLEEVVETAVETFQVRLRDSGFDVAYSPPVHPLPPVRMDPDAIGQVVHNLLDNAVKYSGESKRVEVTLGDDDAFITCEVRDHGIGIPKGDQAKVFERFHRVGNSLVHDVQGSGLGLSIVQHVVQAHHGEVHVESEPGEGTTVRVRLPRNGVGESS